MVIEREQIMLQELDDHQELHGLKNLLVRDVVDSEDEEDEDEEDDLQYMLILQNLKEYDKSYIIEYEEDGLRDAIKYEGASGSDAECDQEPREKQRRQHDGPSNQMPLADTPAILDLHWPPSVNQEPREKPRKQHDGPPNKMPRADTPVIFDSPCTPNGKMKVLTLRKMRSKSKSELGEKEKLLDENKVPVPKYRRKLRSATKQTDEHLNRVPDADSRPTPTREMEKLTRKNPRRESRSEKDEDVVILDSVCHTSRKPERLSAKSKSEYNKDTIQIDPDYHNFLQDLKQVNYAYVCMAKEAEVVYEIKGGYGTKMKEDDDDKSNSDVEIIDSSAFYKSEFRHKVIVALRKPFDKEEYEKLWRDINLQKPKERHMDLRGGRERPVGTQEYGKSYLDHHPDLKKLLEEQDSLPKRLNLLRGFFLFIKHSGEFCPWLDDECLAVRPRFR